MGQIIDPAMDTWADAQYDSALVPVNDGVAAIAYSEHQGAATYDPNNTDWIYAATKRLSIDNKTRRGILDKSTETIYEEMILKVNGIVPLYSHKQPDQVKYPNKARHADEVEWCESRNDHKTSTRGLPCGNCPAFKECSWKWELTVTVPNSEDGDEYLFTIPTKSVMRFRNDVLKPLNQKFGLREKDVLFRVFVTVEENNAGENAPVVNFQPLTPDGETINLNAPTTPNRVVAPAPRPTTQQLATSIPGVQRGAANLKPQAAATISKDQFQDAVNALALKYEASDKKNLDTVPAEMRATKSEEVKKKRVQKAQIALGKTALKGDEELRHTFVREHFTEAFEGSLTELDRAQLGALADTLDRPEAIAYVNAWVDLMTGK